MDNLLLKIEQGAILILATAITVGISTLTVIKLKNQSPQVLGIESCQKTGYCSKNEECCSGVCQKKPLLVRLPTFKKTRQLGICQPIEETPMPTRRPLPTQVPPADCPNCWILRRNLKSLVDNVSCSPFESQLQELLDQVSSYCQQ